MKTRLKLTKTGFVQLQEIEETKNILVAFVQPGLAKASYRGRQVFVSEEMIVSLLPFMKENTLMFDNHEGLETRELHEDTVSWIVPETLRLAKEGEFPGVVKGSAIGEIKFSSNPATQWMEKDIRENKNLFELSIASGVVYKFEKIDDVEVAVAKEAWAHFSTDWVAFGAAGGKVLAASLDSFQMTKEDFLERVKTKEKFEARIETGKEEITNFGVIDQINKRTLVNVGWTLLDYFADLLFFTDLPFDEMEEKMEEAIDQVFELIKSMDIFAMFGIDKDGDSTNMSIEQLPNILSNFVWTDFGDKKVIDVPFTISNGTEERQVTSTFTFKEDEIDDNEEDITLKVTKEQVLEFLMESDPTALLTLLQNLAPVAEMQESLISLGKEVEALKTEKTELSDKVTEQTVKIEKFEAAKADQKKKDEEIALQTDIDALLTKNELKEEEVPAEIMLAIKSIEKPEDRQKFISTITVKDGSLILMNTDEVVDDSEAKTSAEIMATFKS